MKKLLLFLTLIIPVIGFSQTSIQGMQWKKNASQDSIGLLYTGQTGGLDWFYRSSFLNGRFLKTVDSSKYSIYQLLHNPQTVSANWTWDNTHGIKAGSFQTYDVGGGNLGITTSTIVGSGSLGINAANQLSITAGTNLFLNAGSGDYVAIGNGTPGVNTQIADNNLKIVNNGHYYSLTLPTLTTNYNLSWPLGQIAVQGDTTGLGNKFIRNIPRTGTPQVASQTMNGLWSIQDGTVDINSQYYATSGATISTRWRAAIAITTNPDSLGDHAFTDMTNVYHNINGTGHASYDSRIRVTGTGNNSHTVILQDGTSYESTGTQDFLYTIISAPTIKAGAIGERRAFRIENAALTNGATLGIQNGLYIDPLTSGSTANNSIFSKGTQKLHHEGDVELFETTGTILGGRYLRFLTGSASPVASLQSVYNSTTWGDLVFNARYTTGTSDAATKEVFRVIGGASPGVSTIGAMSVTGNTTLGGNITYTNTLASAPQLISPLTATSGNSQPFTLQANINNANDTDGGPAINMIPAANGTGATSGGRINITAYSAETGTTANTIRLFNRSGSGTVGERLRIGNDGSVQFGSGYTTTSTGLTQFGASTTAKASIHFNTGGVDPTSPIGGDVWYKTNGISYFDGNIRMVANLNGAQSLSNKTLASTNTFQSGTGTTADSLGFWSSQKKVAKLLVAGNGITLSQTSTSLTISGNPAGLIIGTPTVAAGAGAGTSPTVTVTSNGRGLQLTVTTGTLPTGTNATIATITLANALSYTPYPVFSSANAITSLLSGASMIYMSSTGAANITITSGTTALTAATTYVWNIAL